MKNLLFLVWLIVFIGCGNEDGLTPGGVPGINFSNDYYEIINKRLEKIKEITGLDGDTDLHIILLAPDKYDQKGFFAPNTIKTTGTYINKEIIQYLLYKNKMNWIKFTDEDGWTYDIRVDYDYTEENHTPVESEGIFLDEDWSIFFSEMFTQVKKCTGLEDGNMEELSIQIEPSKFACRWYDNGCGGEFVAPNNIRAMNWSGYWTHEFIHYLLYINTGYPDTNHESELFDQCTIS